MDLAGEIIRYLGFLQGLFLAGLCFSKRRHKSNLYLSVFLFMLSLHIFVPIGNSALFSEYPFIVAGMSFFPFIYGPLVYHYFYHSLYPSIKPRIPFAFHLVPGALECISLTVIYVITGPEVFRRYLDDFFSGKPLILVTLFDTLKIISGVIYCGLIIGLVKENLGALKKWIEEKHHKTWLTALIISFLSCWITVAVLFIFRTTEAISTWSMTIIWIIQIIIFTIFLYVITFFTLKYPVIFAPQIVRQQIKKKLNLSAPDIITIKEKLEAAMGEEIFRDESLNLKKLAKKIETHQNILSYVLNEEYNKNFKEYINVHRLEAFKNDVASMDIKVDTILSLAYEAGFSSKSTFNRVFKEQFGITPSEYLKTYKNS